MLVLLFAAAGIMPAEQEAAQASTGQTCRQETAKASTGQERVCRQAAAAATTAHEKYYNKIIRSESRWLASTQLDNGTFPEYSVKSGKTAAEPYYADFVCLALLDGGTKYSVNVREYMDWYFEHMNTPSQDENGLDGTVYDYWEYVGPQGHVIEERVRRTKQGKKYYDSTDSYAAMFLSVLCRYYQVTENKEYISEHGEDIHRIVKVIFRTAHGGLTYATPAYKIKYLMDNTEVYSGLGAAQKLSASALGEPGYANSIGLVRKKMKRKILTSMWTKKQHGHFHPALDDSGACGKFRWKRFYPDAVSQLFPEIYGVIKPQSRRSRHVYKYFNKYWSENGKSHSWEKLKTTDENCWGDIAYAAVRINDYKRANTYMKYYYKKYAVRHQYPLYNADSAKVLRAAYLMKKQCRKK